MKKYSKSFERDYNWYLKWKDVFTFDGQINELIKGDISTGIKPLIISSESGKSAKECWFYYDSQGKIIPTSESQLLFQIHKCKGSINFHIKLWAEDRAKGYLPKIEFEKIVEEFELLDWMVNAVEKQKYKFYE